MLLDYELLISCALAALVFLYIIDQRRKRIELRERARPSEDALDALRHPDHIHQAKKAGSRRSGHSKAGHLYHRLIVILLVLALVWFGGRIWLEAASKAI